MNKCIWHKLLLTAVCALTLASMAVAHEVNIPTSAKILNGPELKPGTYRVEVVKNLDSAEVKFFKNGELKAVAPATLTKEGSKNKNTEIHSSAGDDGTVITKIFLKDWNESLVFGGEKTKSD